MSIAQILLCAPSWHTLRESCNPQVQILHSTRSQVRGSQEDQVGIFAHVFVHANSAWTGVRVGVTVRGTPGEPQKHLHSPSFEGSKQQRTWRASHEIRPLSTNLISQVAKRAYRRAKGRSQRNPAGITTYRGRIMTLQELGSMASLA